MKRGWLCCKICCAGLSSKISESTAGVATMAALVGVRAAAQCSSSSSTVEVGGNSEGLWGNRQHIVVVVDDRAEALPTLPAYHGLLHHISSLSLLMLPSQVRWWCCYYYFYSSNAAYTLSTSKVKQRIFPEKS